MADIPLSSIAGGAAGVIPYLPPATTYRTKRADADHFCGFDNDGDRIELPTGSYTGTFFYYDSSNNVVTDGLWTGGLTVADCVSAGATGMDGWVNFYMNDDGSLLYVIGLDNTPLTFYTMTIDKLGVLTILGSCTLAAIPSANYRWLSSSIQTSMQFISGEFVLWSAGASSTATGKTVIDATTGALVSEDGAESPVIPPLYVTPTGIRVGGFTGSSDPYIQIYTATSGQRLVFVPATSGVPTGSSNQCFIYWRGFIVAHMNYNAKAFLQADLDTWLEAIAEHAGVVV